jgi:ArsR family transcriptional regulator, arsenate/arsenite/antimonite-responsive transcriptional repressor
MCQCACIIGAVQADLVSLFAALADRTRLRVLNLLKCGEVCVCYFVEILAESQPKVSRHLAYLRRAGVVHARRDGKWIHYSIAKPSDPTVAAVLEATLAALERDKQMQRDRAALERVCCGAKLPETLQNAPRPQLTV